MKKIFKNLINIFVYFNKEIIKQKTKIKIFK